MNDVLAILSDPNVAFVLFVIGALGIAVETVQPNLVTGVLGGFALVLAFIGFGSLPLNVGALLLVGFAFVLFVLETQFTSHGLLGVAGIAAFALGASMLYTDTPLSSGSLARVAPAMILLTTGTVATLMLLVSVAAVRTHRMRAPADIVGTPPVAGTAGTVQAPLEPLGSVHLGGETWSARTRRGLSLARDTPVRLLGFDGLTAIVEPASAQAGSVDAITASQPPASLPADRT